jgi:hypothetical protein
MSGALALAAVLAAGSCKDNVGITVTARFTATLSGSTPCPGSSASPRRAAPRSEPGNHPLYVIGKEAARKRLEAALSPFGVFWIER